MTKRRVRIKMKGESTTLNTEGAIYRSPYHAGAEPVVAQVRVRRTEADEFDVAPGRYEYRFDVQDDRGTFELEATYGGAPPPFASDKYDTAVAMNDLQLVFTVKGPS
ncbi:uncharacterized protein SOCE26_002550 [Sorangium cellulosum]|uniref:Uncharacterized protein n=1 Tax=Sorangium cellulosum TaxID=56 RepID=A0A2L0EHW5_SORCE|nr:hypothetical protein [Sorangium cellulosum]AUX38875.1 uncharacterized protein SOCE26_002550 [Sorangium cellulosum]